MKIYSQIQRASAPTTTTVQLRRMDGRAASAPAASAEVDTSLAAPAPRFLREALEDDGPKWADVYEDDAEP